MNPNVAPASPESDSPYQVDDEMLKILAQASNGETISSDPDQAAKRVFVGLEAIQEFQRNGVKIATNIQSVLQEILEAKDVQGADCLFNLGLNRENLAELCRKLGVNGERLIPSEVFGNNQELSIQAVNKIVTDFPHIHGASLHADPSVERLKKLCDVQSLSKFMQNHAKSKN